MHEEGITMSKGNTLEESALNETRTRITQKGQITLPAHVRKALDLHPGDTVSVALDEDGDLKAIIRRAPPVTELTHGMFHRPGVSFTDEEIKRAVELDRAQRYARKLGLDLKTEE
jgi:AbrB family looped-hinge helix DNA binding protein